MELSQTSTYTQTPGYFRRLNTFDWLYAALLLAGAVYALNRFGDAIAF